MNVLRKIGMLSILAVMCLAATSCMDEDKGYEILPLPPVHDNLNIKDVIPKEYLDNLKSAGFPIYEGTTPPNVVGCYLDDSRYLVASNVYSDPLNSRFANFLWRFFNQNKNNSIFYDAREFNYLDGSTVSSEYGSGSISGSGSDFTTFFITSSKIGNANSKIAVIMSGTKTSVGIKDYLYAFLMLDKVDPKNELVEKGSIRVFANSNFLAKNANWNNGKGKESFASEEANIASELNSFIMRSKTSDNPNNTPTVLLPKLVKGGKK